MDVKEAAGLAKRYVADLFAEEGIADVGLEEIELDATRGFWEVTVGFSRPWDHGGLATISLGKRALRRSYKVLRVDADNGSVASVRDRILQEAK